MKRGCSRKGCGKEARWQMLLVAVAPTGQEAPGEMGLYLCDEHKEQTTFEELFKNTSGSWGMIQRGFLAKGFAAPSYAQSRIDFKSLEDEEEERV